MPSEVTQWAEHSVSQKGRRVTQIYHGESVFRDVCQAPAGEKPCRSWICQAAQIATVKESPDTWIVS